MENTRPYLFLSVMVRARWVLTRTGFPEAGHHPFPVHAGQEEARSRSSQASEHRYVDSAEGVTGLEAHLLGEVEHHILDRLPVPGHRPEGFRQGREVRPLLVKISRIAASFF